MPHALRPVRAVLLRATLAFAAGACARRMAEAPPPHTSDAPQARKSDAPAPRIVEGTLAITDVTVIDVVAGVARPNMAVVVSGERIVAVEPADAVHVADRTVAVDGAGRFLIPGLWDMHAHVMEEGTSAAFLRYGITGVRHMFSFNHGVPDPTPTDAPAPPRPRYVAAAHVLDGTRTVIPMPFNRRVLQADTAADARKQVHALKGLGAPFVKVYSRLPPDAYFAAVAEAKTPGVGLTVAGHVPYGVTASQASDAGHHTIEHLDGVAAMCSRCARRWRSGARPGSWIPSPRRTPTRTSTGGSRWRRWKPTTRGSRRSSCASSSKTGRGTLPRSPRRAG